MEAKTPSRLVIEDGQFAEGKKIQVTHDNRFDATSTVLEELKFLLGIQQPGDKITLECKTISTRNGELTSCQLSFTRDSDDVRPF